MKVVFDTNIYISAFLIPGGNAEKVYVHAIDGVNFAPLLQSLRNWAGHWTRSSVGKNRKLFS